MNDGYRYLVRNIAGSIILKCKNSQQVDDFIEWHYRRSHKALKTIFDKPIEIGEAYDVIDLDSVTSFYDIDLT